MKKLLIILSLMLLINPVFAQTNNEEIQELDSQVKQLQEQINRKEDKKYIPISYSSNNGANSGVWLGNKLRNLFKNDEK